MTHSIDSVTEIKASSWHEWSIRSDLFSSLHFLLIHLENQVVTEMDILEGNCSQDEDESLTAFVTPWQ